MAMNERPILFTGEMVRATLDGRKTQTRQVVRPPKWVQTGPHKDKRGHFFWLSSSRAHYAETWPRFSIEPGQANPYGQPGDLLWVRETWAERGGNAGGRRDRIWYRADGHKHGPWRPSTHMPKWATRLWLRVTDVRVERVQDITLDDCRAEGISCPSQFVTGAGAPVENPAAENWEPDAAFADLWDSINAKRGFGWDTNPWVWAVSFEVEK